MYRETFIHMIHMNLENIHICHELYVIATHNKILNTTLQSLVLKSILYVSVIVSDFDSWWTDVEERNHMMNYARDDGCPYWVLNLY